MGLFSKKPKVPAVPAVPGAVEAPTEKTSIADVANVASTVGAIGSSLFGKKKTSVYKPKTVQTRLVAKKDTEGERSTLNDISAVTSQTINATRGSSDSGRALQGALGAQKQSIDAIAKTHLGYSEQYAKDQDEKNKINLSTEMQNTESVNNANLINTQNSRADQQAKNDGNRDAIMSGIKYGADKERDITTRNTTLNAMEKSGQRDLYGKAIVAGMKPEDAEKAAMNPLFTSPIQQTTNNGFLGIKKLFGKKKVEPVPPVAPQ